MHLDCGCPGLPTLFSAEESGSILCPMGSAMGSPRQDSASAPRGRGHRPKPSQARLRKESATAYVKGTKRNRGQSILQRHSCAQHYEKALERMYMRGCGE